jgi:hypothetical protein
MIFFLDAKVVNICLTSKKNGLQKCAHPVLRTFAKGFKRRVRAKSKKDLVNGGNVKNIS